MEFGCGDQAAVGNRSSSCVEDISVIQRRGDIRPVEDVEEFRAKLQVECVRDSLDEIILEH